MISSDILVVELLESVMADAEIIRRCIELKKLGYIIALDDYEYGENTKALFELADIIKFQHGYNVAAKFISVQDELLDTLINRLGV